MARVIHQVVGANKIWHNEDKTEKPLKTKTFVVRDGDRFFIKVYPAFTKAILAALQDKKLAGAGELIFYFMGRLMSAKFNGTRQEIGIKATAEEIVQATGKGIRAVRNNLRTLIELGFLEQPHRGIPIYVVPPEYIYKGVLLTLHEREAKGGDEAVRQALREMKAQRQKIAKK
jgi:hypothetical protein